MDKFTLGKVAQTLFWEHIYRKKNADDKSIYKHFLAPQTTLDPDFEKYFTNLKIITGELLDVGTGTGEQAIYLAKKGFNVTAIDASLSAILNAKKLAEQNNIDLNFIEDNILLSKLTGLFDIIIDRGCFTVIPKEFNSDYLASIKKLLNINGWVFLKVDKKKSDRLKVFREDPAFKIYASEESNYISLIDKIVPAVVLILQKTKDD